VVGRCKGRSLSEAGQTGPRITAWRVEDIRAPIEKREHEPQPPAGLAADKAQAELHDRPQAV